MKAEDFSVVLNVCSSSALSTVSPQNMNISEMVDQTADTFRSWGHPEVSRPGAKAAELG